MEYLIYKSFNNIKTEEIIPKALEIAVQNGVSGKLCRIYTAYMIINDENLFSVLCEKSDMPSGTLAEFAERDILRAINVFCDSDETYFNAPTAVKTDMGKAIEEFTRNMHGGKILKAAADIYKKYGVGMIGTNKAFYINESGTLTPVRNFDDVKFSDLWGYDRQKNMLKENTEKFIKGTAANNVLLYGDSGTGKSTCIKALLNEYYEDGLRIVEVSKSGFKYLKELTGKLRERNYRFIIYMDDLSFEDFETEYKYLKSIMEGGMEEKADNVLIYATSNRRHLIKESWHDRDDMDSELHRSDTMQEKLSLADRFGLAINFTKPMQTEYYDMVRYLAKLEHIEISDDELIAGARRWELTGGGMSGRCARQYINHINAKE